MTAPFAQRNPQPRHFRWKNASAAEPTNSTWTAVTNQARSLMTGSKPKRRFWLKRKPSKKAELTSHVFSAALVPAD